MHSFFEDGEDDFSKQRISNHRIGGVPQRSSPDRVQNVQRDRIGENKLQNSKLGACSSSD